MIGLGVAISDTGWGLSSPPVVHHRSINTMEAIRINFHLDGAPRMIKIIVIVPIAEGNTTNGKDVSIVNTSMAVRL